MSATNKSAGSGEVQLLDVSELVRVYGKEGCHEILSLFLKEMRGLLDETPPLVASQNSAAVSRIGHQIKGLSAFIICADMEPLSRRLETAGNQSDWAEATAAHALLEDLFLRVTVLINELLPSLVE